MSSSERSPITPYPWSDTIRYEWDENPNHELNIHYISSDIPGSKWDGSPIRIIADIKAHTQEHPSSRYLDQPLFGCADGTIQSTENPIINSDDCNPVFLINLADRLANNDMPYPIEIKEKVIEGIRAVFLEGATPRMFHNELSQYARFIFKDDERPETYRATAKLFFGSMAKKSILAFDIHDLLHHPLQLSVWSEQFRAVSGAAFAAHAMPDEQKGAVRLQKLTQLLWLATFEESLITIDNQLVSFGCLNWLAPAETPLDRVPDIRLLPVEQQKVAYRWHYLDALKDMYRIQSSSSQQLNSKLDWLERLGYSTDRRFTELCNSDEVRPFENLDFNDATRFDIQTPTSPEELFANAIQLIEEEFNAQG